MRLIDADNFEKELSSVWKWLVDRDKKGYGTTHGEMLDKVHDILIKQPTAYDVDSVVEELEGSMWLTTNDDGETNNLSIQVVSFEDAIEIVKQGGVYDDVCEWKQTSTAKYKTSCGYKLEEYFDTNACYCKQCGKKIKVVE